VKAKKGENSLSRQSISASLLPFMCTYLQTSEGTVPLESIYSNLIQNFVDVHEFSISKRRCWKLPQMNNVTAFSFTFQRQNIG